MLSSSPLSPLSQIPLQQQQQQQQQQTTQLQSSSSLSSLNFRLTIRCDGYEQYLNIPSFEEISNLYKIGLKKAHLKESDVVACINVQRLRVLRINGKLRDQINNGDTIWYVTLEDWDAYVKIMSKGIQLTISIIVTTTIYYYFHTLLSLLLLLSLYYRCSYTTREKGNVS